MRCALVATACWLSLAAIACFGPTSDASHEWYVHPKSWYRLPMPDGWSTFGGPDDWTILQDPILEESIVVSFQHWSAYGANDSARTILERSLGERLVWLSPWEILQAPTERLVDGHEAAETFVRQNSQGQPIRLMKLAVVVAPEWEYAWTIEWSSAPPSFDMAPLANATLDSFDILDAPPLMWFFHPASHFRIRVPQGWTADGNRSIDGQRYDVIMSHPRPASFAVASISRATAGRATTDLAEAIDDARAFGNVLILEPPSTRVIDGHEAAMATIELNTGTSEAVRQVMTVVLDSQLPRTWVLVGSMRAADAGQFQPVANSTILSFDALPATPSWFESPLLPLGVFGAGVAAAVAAVLWLRRRRPPGLSAASQLSPPQDTADLMEKHKGKSEDVR